MLNKKIIFAILIIGFFVISSASANENAINGINIENSTNTNPAYNNSTIDNENNIGTFEELSQEIKSVEEGDVLNLNKDYKYVNGSNTGIIISKAITIDGGQGKTIDGNKNSAIFRITNPNVILKNINFINSYSDKYSAVYGSCTIINCSFINCFSEKSGGAINAYNNYTSTISYCDFINNSAGTDGGAIFSKSIPCNINYCNFINNSAANYGGAICINKDASHNISNCYFTGNSAKNGGAIFGDGIITYSNFVNNLANENGIIYTKKESSLNNCNFSNNAANNGGAIYSSENSICNLNNSTFTNNSATNYGGAVCTHKDTFHNINNCYFTGNSANSGSAIYGDGIITYSNFDNNLANNSGTVYIKKETSLNNCNFNNNIAKDGGAIYSYSTSQCNLNNSNFTNNSAANYGGAICTNINSSHNITNCYFTGNSANNGAAIYGDGIITYSNFDNNLANNSGIIYTKKDSRISNCNFNNNAAKDGGAIYSSSTSQCNLNNSNFTNNTATNTGGAICTHKDTSHNITNCYFTGNSAKNGAAICGDGIITYSNFVNNLANNSGTVFTKKDSIFSNCNFSNNAATYGGAIYSSDTSDCDLNKCNFNNNSATDGGSIYTSNIYYNITECNFTNNVANNSGGAIRCEGFVKDCIFTNNAATYGGGIYSYFIIKNLSNCIFINNTAVGEGNETTISDDNNSTIVGTGGGVYCLQYGNLFNCSFINNTAIRGGAMCGGNVTLNNCICTGNIAKYGASLYVHDESDIFNCNFTNNNADISGGGVYCYYNATCTVNYCHFINNNALAKDKGKGYGGAITNYYELNVSNCIFINNHAENSSGGGIHSGLGICNVYNCIFINNAGEEQGGAVYRYQDLNDCSIIDSCIFINNAGGYGGAVFGSFNISNCNFTNNTASISGGAIYSENTPVVKHHSTVINSIFEKNNAEYHGGSFYGNGYLSDCTFSDNSAKKDGGAIYGNKTNLTNCNFTKDIAGRNGGAIYIGTAYNCSIMDCSAERYGGAIYMGIAYGCSFTNCSAKIKGNGIGNSSAENCIFIECGNEKNAIYISNITNCTIIVPLSPLNIECEDITVTYNDGETLVAALKDEAGTGIGGLNVNVEINNINSTLTTDNDGKINIFLTDLLPNVYTATISFAGNEIYESAQTTATVTINKANTKLTAANVTATYKGDGNITATLSDANNNAISGTLVKVVLNGVTNDLITDNNGQVSLSLNAITPGDYTASITFDGNEIYNRSAAGINVVVNKANTIISAPDVTVAYKDTDAKLVATITNQYGKPLNVNLNVDLNGQTTTIKANSKGQINIPTDTLYPGTYTATITYSGNNNYKPTTTTANVVVTKANTIISAKDTTVTYKDTTGQLVATLKNTYGNALSVNVNVNLNGQNYTIKANSKGQINIPTENLPIGTHVAAISYNGNNNYNPSSATANIIVGKANTIISAENITVAYKDPSEQTIATLTDSYGNAINDTANVILNGKTYTVKADSEGQISISTADLYPGNYVASISYNGNDNYNPSSATANIAVTKADTVIAAPDVTVTYKDTDGKLIATLTNQYGKPLSVNLNVDLNGQTTTIKANSKGQINIPTDTLYPGTYTATITYSGNNNYKPTTTTANVVVTKANTIISAKDTTVTYKDTDGKLVATITNQYGKPLGVNVNVKLNGKTTTVKADSKGQISIPTDTLYPGTYKATITYAGNGNYKSTTKTVNVVVNKADTSISVAYTDENVVATLTSQYGKPLSVNLNVNINGQTYIIKADSKGQISIPTKDLAPGTYTATISYKGNGNYNPSNATAEVVIKIGTEISASDITVVYKDSGELVATITDADGNALSGVDLNINFNKKTYTVTSDSNGQISILINEVISPKTYVATISYAGDDTYAASSTTANVVVAKADTTINAPDVTVKQGDANGKFVARITNQYGSSIGVNLNININGETYTLRTDTQGKVIWSTENLAKGTYTATVTYAGNGNYNPTNTTATITVK